MNLRELSFADLQCLREYYWSAKQYPDRYIWSNDITEESKQKMKLANERIGAINKAIQYKLDEIDWE